MENLRFRKKGSEIKKSIEKRLEQLEIRLNVREEKLEHLFDNKERLKSYLIRSSVTSYGHYVESPTIYGKDEISSEEVEEINQMCRRIH
jgi:hypothetical protein